MIDVRTGDCRALLRAMPAESVHCVVTSPPYLGQRSYQAGDAEIGHEPSIAEYVVTMVAVMREVRRVMRPDATLWLVLGDKYSGSGGAGGDYNAGGIRAGQPKFGTFRSGASRANGVVDGRGIRNRNGAPALDGLPPKSLCMVPARVAIAMQDDGWLLRSEITWAKKSAMPQSVTDRPTNATERIYLFAKQGRYYYDRFGYVEPSKGWRGSRFGDGKPGEAGLYAGQSEHGENGSSSSANLRDFWLLGPDPYDGLHYATFPVEIPRRAILLGSRPGDTVLDPFSGAGTTGLAAQRLGRDYIGLELNPEYVRLSQQRLADDLLTEADRRIEAGQATLFDLARSLA